MTYLAKNTVNYALFLGETHPSYNRSEQLSHSELEVTVPATIPRQLHIYLGKADNYWKL